MQRNKVAKVDLFSNILCNYYGGPPKKKVQRINIPIENWKIIEDFYNNITKATATRIGVRNIGVRFSSNSGICAHLHDCGQEDYLVVLPIGLLARLWAMGRKIWSYRDHAKKGIAEKAFLVIGTSPADDYDPNNYYVPPICRCIFDEYENTKDFWIDLRKFDKANDHDESMDFNVGIMVNQALMVVLAHEIGHLALKHFEFKRDVIDGHFQANQHVKDLLRKGLELEADFYAGQWLSYVYCDDARAQDFFSSDYATDFYRMGFGLYVLLGMYDPRVRSLQSYLGKTYPHPIVRHHAIRMGILESLPNSPPNLASLWRQKSTEGWIRASLCLNFFNVLEVHGSIDPTQNTEKSPLIPVHALNYAGPATAPYIQEHVKAGEELFKTTKRIREEYLLNGAVDPHRISSELSSAKLSTAKFTDFDYASSEDNIGKRDACCGQTDHNSGP